VDFMDWDKRKELFIVVGFCYLCGVLFYGECFGVVEGGCAVCVLGLLFGYEKGRRISG